MTVLERSASAESNWACAMLNLLDRGRQSGFGHVIGRFGRQEIRFGNQLGLEQGVISFVFQQGLFQIGIRSVFIGDSIFEIARAESRAAT